MTDVRTFLDQASVLCLQVVGLAWLLAAGYFALRVPGSWRARTGHFLRTLLPEPWLLVAGPAVAVALGLVPHATWQHLEFWNPVLAAVGFAVVLCSTALMLWARWVLGRMWAGRPLVQQGHELCTSGPYRLVRHPIYAGIVGLALGGMLVAGFAQMLVVLPATIAFAAWRVRIEDRIMIDTFGDRYRAYRSRVPALLPVAH
jgi:protein-S-isoprenylcysteine O-methyltransferase Ste14